MQNNLEVPLFRYPNLPSDAGDPSSPCTLQRWTHWNATRLDQVTRRARGIETFGKTQINLFMSWSLTHWWLWLTGKFNTAFLQTLAKGAEQIDPTAHIMKQLRPRRVYASLLEPSSQLFQQGVKVKLWQVFMKECKPLGSTSGFILERRASPFNSARPDLVWIQKWRVSWLVQDPFWRCVGSCQLDQCVIVFCPTLFSKWCIGCWCNSLCSNKISVGLLDKHGLLSKVKEILFQNGKKKHPKPSSSHVFLHHTEAV